jgi:integrase
MALRPDIPWPSYAMARDLAGNVFPVSEAVILQTRVSTASAARWAAPSYSVPMIVPNYMRFCRAPRSQASAKVALLDHPGTLSGFRVEESTGTSDKRIAEEIRAKREAEILAQSVYGNRATATFASAALSYLQQGGSKRFTVGVISHFGTTPLAKIDQDALDRGAKRLYPNASPSTRNRQFYAIASSILHHAARRGWCPPPIIERPAMPPGRIRCLPIDEADCLIMACSDHLRPLVIFMLYTGARTGEALWLDWRDVDLSRAHVQFPKTKNGDARGVPLHPRVVAALANLEGRTGEVFRRPDGRPYSRGVLTTRRQAPASRTHSRAHAGGPVSSTFIRMIVVTPGRPGTTRRTATSAG